MVTTEESRHRKREYVIVKKGTHRYYAKLSVTDPDTYIVMAEVGIAEGADIVNKANQQSSFNREVDAIHEHAKRTV